MNRRLKHRGPDDEGFEVSDFWTLGQTRLSILDLSEQGHQPMSTRDGRYTIVFNGEVYNFSDIRKELEVLGISFRSHTDTEVVLYAFAMWQEKCLDRFNGMFALAIQDNHSGDVFIARDRIGEKPLYYFEKDGVFVFSSEAKAIFEHDIPREIDIDALNIYFRMLYVPSPYTLWKNIKKLPPAHYAWVRNGRIELTRYWSYPNEPLLTDRSEAEERIRVLMRDSVRLQMISDRPVGVFLSGGIDSTIITGLASELSPEIDTFSVGFEADEEMDKYNMDMKIARETARHFGTTHHEYVLRAEDIIGSLERAAYHMDEPISNHVQAVNLLLAEHASKVVTVALGGDGGDELFGGYERYFLSHKIDQVQRLPKFLYDNVLAKKFAEKLGKPGMYNMMKSKQGVERYLAFFAQKDDTVQRFLKPNFFRTFVTEEAYERMFFEDSSENGFVRDFMRGDLLAWLPDESLTRSDRMSMAVGLEERVPFLDHRLVELADRIPVQWKLGQKSIKGMFSPGAAPYVGKQILREAMSDYLPDFVLEQRKWGWFSPAAKWLRGPMKDLAYEVLSEGYCHDTKDIFDFVEIRRMLDAHVDRSAYALVPLWSLISFQLWYRQFAGK